MQRSLFKSGPTVDQSKDPYAAQKAAGRRLAERFAIAETEAFDAVVVHGTEERAAEVLHKRWLLGNLETAA